MAKDISDQRFYDRVAVKFGGYRSGVVHTEKFTNGDPERVFLGKLRLYSGNDLSALDIGCADGRFTLKVSPYFKHISAIDVSERMLDSAKQLQTERTISNVTFEKINAENLPFKNESFDVVYCRRGPTPYREIRRVLKRKGYFIEIRIGEKDARELKEVFGRGQNFGEWHISIIEIIKKELEMLGYRMVFAEDYIYSEYYPDIEKISLWLESVPIFMDYDSKKDRESLLEYVKKWDTKDGIELKRHRSVIVAQKI